MPRGSLCWVDAVTPNIQEAAFAICGRVSLWKMWRGHCGFCHRRKQMLAIFFEKKISTEFWLTVLGSKVALSRFFKTPCLSQQPLRQVMLLAICLTSIKALPYWEQILMQTQPGCAESLPPLTHSCLLLLLIACSHLLQALLGLTSLPGTCLPYSRILLHCWEFDHMLTPSNDSLSLLLTFKILSIFSSPNLFTFYILAVLNIIWCLCHFPFGCKFEANMDHSWVYLFALSLRPTRRLEVPAQQRLAQCAVIEWTNGA